MKEEVEEATPNLPTGKSPESDNIPAELLKHDGSETVKIMTALCKKIWEYNAQGNSQNFY